MAQLLLVFDGYTNEPSTKDAALDATHLRRTGTCSGVTVHFTGDKLFGPRKMSPHHKENNGSLNFTKEQEKMCGGQCQAGC